MKYNYTYNLTIINLPEQKKITNHEYYKTKLNSQNLNTSGVTYWLLPSEY